MSNDLAAVARPYARALLSASGTQKESVYACLASAALVLEDPSLAAILANPVLDRQVLSQAFAFSVDACAPVAALIKLLIENDRLAALPSIRSAFMTLKDEAESRVRATITTALPLTDTDKEILRAALMRRTKQDVDLTVEVDARLLAGVIVQQGDMVLDGSVRGRLAALAHALSPF